jgi:hypothetical protein
MSTNRDRATSREDNDQPQVNDDSHKFKDVDVETRCINRRFNGCICQEFHVEPCVDQVVAIQSPFEGVLWAAASDMIWVVGSRVTRYPMYDCQIGWDLLSSSER